MRGWVGWVEWVEWVGLEWVGWGFAVCFCDDAMSDLTNHNPCRSPSRRAGLAGAGLAGDTGLPDEGACITGARCVWLIKSLTHIYTHKIDDFLQG